MATSSYKVKKGDTLGGIAKTLGVSTKDLTGYRSGNPDLIYEGETINIGGAPKDDASTYASTVKEELGDTGGTSKGSSLYDLDSLKGEVGDYKSKLDSSFKKLQSIQTEVYDREYKDRELDSKKEKMASLDSAIAQKRQERDAAIAKVRANPGLSAAQMTGDIKKMADYANSEINNLIGERNSVAGEYNTELDEIDKIVAREAAEAGSEYKYYLDLLTGTESKIGDYSKALTEELKQSRDDDRFDRQLEQALTIAGMRGSGGGSNLRLVSDGLGGFVIFDPDSGNVSTVEDEDVDSGGGAIFNNAAKDTAKKDGNWFSDLWGALGRGTGLWGN